MCHRAKIRILVREKELSKLLRLSTYLKRLRDAKPICNKFQDHTLETPYELRICTIMIEIYIYLI